MYCPLKKYLHFFGGFPKLGSICKVYYRGAAAPKNAYFFLCSAVNWVDYKKRGNKAECRWILRVAAKKVPFNSEHSTKKGQRG